MKATSIEQIREHLAKGGRVMRVATDPKFPAISVKHILPDNGLYSHGVFREYFDSKYVDHWQLIPLEEKEPVEVCRNCNGAGVVMFGDHTVYPPIKTPTECIPCKGTGHTQKASEPVDHGTQKAIEVRTWGAGTIERVVVRCDKHGDLWFVDVDEDDSDNAKLVLHREDATKLGRWLLGEPDGTQKGQDERDWSGVYPKDCYAFRDSQKERMQRIRQRLLHGQWPEMSDLLDWWEATTGERIE